MFVGVLNNLNIELTDKCNKNCWMCGRRKREQQNPKLIKTYGNMDFALVEKIAKEVPPDITVQFHNNGESLMYPRFGDAVRLFDKQIKNIVTNGKLLLEKFDEIVDNLDTISISVIENDPDSEEQYKIVKEFLEKKGDRKPYVIVRRNGNVENIKRYEDLGLKIAYRVLHSPMGSFDYVTKKPTMPEVGICRDLLHHLAINKDGEVSICIRFDPNRNGVIGNIKEQTLKEIWESDLRKEWIAKHLKGQRELVSLCADCDYWGIPIGD